MAVCVDPRCLVGFLGRVDASCVARAMLELAAVLVDVVHLVVVPTGESWHAHAGEWYWRIGGKNPWWR